MDMGAPASFGESPVELRDLAPAEEPSPQPPSCGSRTARRVAHSNWWETRWFVACVVLITAAPLLWPRIPPITDLPGHMGRWHIALALAQLPALQRYYDFHWALIGNLGCDLAVIPLAKLFGLELGTKLLVMFIPMLTVLGLLLVARQVHGRVPPSALLALPLAYAWPFQLGFVNFQLAQALALLAFALWLKLGDDDRLGTRALVMVPLSWGLWIAHDFGWGLFGLLAFGSEFARRRALGCGKRHAFSSAVVQCLPLALPAIAMVLTPTDASQPVSGDWFNPVIKLGWMLSILCDRWSFYDSLSLMPMAMMLYLAARDRRLGYAPQLLIPALLCFAAFLIFPRLLMGGAYVDMRMAPVALALAIVAVRPPEGQRLARTLALCGLLFLSLRLTTTTASFAERSAVQEEELRALDVLPQGASVLNLVVGHCDRLRGTDDRLDHIAGLAIVRRDVFVNEQWALRGQQLLSIRKGAAKPYTGDPSQMVYGSCGKEGTHFARAIAGFDRRAFDHVWTIGFPPGAVHAPDLALIWTNGRSAVYRVVR